MSTQPAPIRVLVIDDERGLRDLLTYAFRRLKFEVSVAEDGAQGVAAALASDYDVVVCDVMMPGINGIAVLQELKRARPRLEVVMVTGFPSDEDSARARESGAFDYLAKPYDLRVLAAVVEKAAASTRAKETT